jgi:hypothetical protein
MWRSAPMSGLMRKRSIAKLAAAIATSACLLLTPSAVAVGRTVWIVRDGFYAGSVLSEGELVYFYVAHGRIYHLRFSMNLDCTSSGVTSNPNFNAGPAMPQGQAIPANGIVSIDWTEREAGREGHINAELAFTRHPNASFSVTSHGDPESCTGFADVPIQRAAVTPPRPTWP